MITKNTNTDTDDLGMYEDDIIDVRAALKKASMPCPNVDREWRRFASRHTEERPAAENVNISRNKRGHATWLWSGIAIGVAATLLCLFALTPLLRRMLTSAETDSPVLVFKAEPQLGGVEMTSVKRSTGGHNVVAFAGDDTETVTLKQEMIDMRTAVADGDITEERTIRTPRGKDMKIVLADGTEVLLNADSRLHFPTRFTDAKREVTLEGEAYFTVAKDKAHPFIVKSGNLVTTALGTEFNVKAYDDNNACVTLINGSVAVNDVDQKQKVVLTPGQDVSSVDGKFVVADTNPKVFTYWKEGFFYFDNVPLVDILTELGRWYNVSVELKSRSLMSYRLHFAADRNCPLSDAISRLNNFSYLKASFDGNKVSVSMAVQASKMSPATRTSR